MKKRCWAAALAGLLLLSVAGCGSSSKESYAVATGSADMMSPAMDMEVAEEAEMDMSAAYDNGESGITSGQGLEAVAETGRKLIRNVNLTLQTREFDSLADGISEQVREMGGYVQNSSAWVGSYYEESTRSADYTVRIPSDRLDEFIKVVSGLGNVVHKDESVEDVTLQYVDTESRKKALETEQERLLALMEQAESLEDLLAIESRLSEVRYELENYGSQLRLLDNQIDYSTVYISIQEVERITENKERTFLEEVSVRFSDSLYEVGRGLRGFAIGFLGSLPILAVWAVVIAVFVLILRKILRRKDTKKEKRRKPWEKKPFGDDSSPEDPAK